MLSLHLKTKFICQIDIFIFFSANQETQLCVSTSKTATYTELLYASLRGTKQSLYYTERIEQFKP